EKNAWVFTRSWSKIYLDQTDETANLFKLTLSDNSQSYTVPISPVLKGKDYAKAAARFKKQEQEYQQALTAFQQQASMQTTRDNLMTSFNVRQMGIYNCDRFYNDPAAITVNAGFKFENNVQPDIDNLTVYLVTDNNVICYSSYMWGNFKFDPHADNKL